MRMIKINNFYGIVGTSNGQIPIRSIHVRSHLIASDLYCDNAFTSHWWTIGNWKNFKYWRLKLKNECRQDDGFETPLIPRYAFERHHSIDFVSNSYWTAFECSSNEWQLIVLQWIRYLEWATNPFPSIHLRGVSRAKHNTHSNRISRGKRCSFDEFFSRSKNKQCQFLCCRRNCTRKKAKKEEGKNNPPRNRWWILGKQKNESNVHFFSIRFLFQDADNVGHLKSARQIARGR